MNGIVRDEIDAARENLIRLLGAAILIADSGVEAAVLSNQMTVEIAFRSSEQIERMEKLAGLL